MGSRWRYGIYFTNPMPLQSEFTIIKDFLIFQKTTNGKEINHTIALKVGSFYFKPEDLFKDFMVPLKSKFELISTAFSSFHLIN
jgi:hypothetical protein